MESGWRVDGVCILVHESLCSGSEVRGGSGMGK